MTINTIEEFEAWMIDFYFRMAKKNREFHGSTTNRDVLKKMFAEDPEYRELSARFKEGTLFDASLINSDEQR